MKPRAWWRLVNEPQATTVIDVPPVGMMDKTVRRPVTSLGLGGAQEPLSEADSTRIRSRNLDRRCQFCNPSNSGFFNEIGAATTSARVSTMSAFRERQSSSLWPTSGASRSKAVVRRLPHEPFVDLRSCGRRCVVYRRIRTQMDNTNISKIGFSV